MRRQFLAILAAFTTLFLAGCPSFWNSVATEDQFSGPDELFKEAESSFEKKDYARAADLFERLKSAYPDFKNMPEVHLKIAEAFFNQESYDAALSQLYQFLELYPNHKDVPRARYQVAMTYFNQIKRDGLDNRAVTQAADAFKLLIDDPNAGEWRSKAEEKFNECRNKLAQRELAKANTYLQSSNYSSARVAAQRVVDEFPKTPQAEEAKEFLQKIKGK